MHHDNEMTVVGRLDLSKYAPVSRNVTSIFTCKIYSLVRALHAIHQHAVMSNLYSNSTFLTPWIQTNLHFIIQSRDINTACKRIHTNLSLYKCQYHEYHTIVWTDLINSSSNRPISPISQCTHQSSHYAPSTTEMSTFSLWTVHCRSPNRCTAVPVKHVNFYGVRSSAVTMRNISKYATHMSVAASPP